MLNKKPRIPSPVQIPEAFSYLQGFRDYLIAQTVSPHTRNAYLSDLIQCAECLVKPLPEWDHDDISDVLIELTKQQKVHVQLHDVYPPYVLFINSYGNKTAE